MLYIVALQKTRECVNLAISVRGRKGKPMSDFAKDTNVPTNDCISRRLAIDAIRAMQTYKLFAGDNMLLVDQAEAQKKLMVLLPAEPQRKKGKWKHIGGDEWCCSQCGYIVTTDGSWEHPKDIGKLFCEHCGADMRGSE